MKKKHVFMAFAFFIVGLVYGAICNFILRGENASLTSCYNQGWFLGMISSDMYLILFWFFGYCVDEEYLHDKVSVNIVFIAILKYGTTMYITSNYEYPITIDYVWMHIVNCFFAIVVVAKASYDGKVLRTKRKK